MNKNIQDIDEDDLKRFPYVSTPFSTIQMWQRQAREKQFYKEQALVQKQDAAIKEKS